MKAALAVGEIPIQESSPALTLAIPRKLLLSIYVIVPVWFAFLAADRLFNGSYFRDPTHVPDLLLRAYFLGSFPHILGSFFSFCDREYFAYYRRRLVLGIPLIIAASFALVYVMPVQFLDPFMRTSSFLHAMNQQLGITGLMLGARAKHFTLWKWVILACSIIAGNTLLCGGSIPFLSHNGLLAVIVLGVTIAFFLTHVVARQASLSVGKYHAWANWGLIVFMVLAAWQNYLLLSHVMARSVHDLSAFAFYMVHDENRNRSGSPNFLYRLLKPTGIAIRGLCPMIAIAIAIALSSFAVVFAFTTALHLMHYYIEYFMWKPNTIHRAHVRLG